MNVSENSQFRFENCFKVNIKNCDSVKSCILQIIASRLIVYYGIFKTMVRELSLLETSNPNGMELSKDFQCLNTPSSALVNRRIPNEIF